MRHIRPLASESEFEAFAWIASNAYPGMKLVSDEDRQQLIQRGMAQQEASAASYYGLFEDATLLGGMRLYDFTMNLRSAKVGAGGVGFVAVDLLHKKRGAAKDMVGHFLRRCREQNQPLAMLYPFRPDFYKQMGFGYGTKMSHYVVRPAHLPKGQSRARIRLLADADKPLLAACYARHANTRHGLIDRTAADVEAVFAHPENRIVGCVEDGVVSGYLVFSFTTDRPDTMLVNDILVKELVYESRAALSELLEFLRTQADQARHVIFNLQDDTFHHLLFDPRDNSERYLATLYQQTNTQGLGIMYRAVDTRTLFASLAGCDFGGQSCALKIAVRDSFLPENAGDVIVHFDRGRPSVRDGGDYDIAIDLDVAELSSLLMGVVSFRSLHRYGLAAISDERHIDTVTRLFAVEEKPICWTLF